MGPFHSLLPPLQPQRLCLQPQDHEIKVSPLRSPRTCQVPPPPGARSVKALAAEAILVLVSPAPGLGGSWKHRSFRGVRTW